MADPQTFDFSGLQQAQAPDTGGLNFDGLSKAPDFVSHAVIPSLEDQLKAAQTPAERVEVLKQTPVGGDLNAVISLYHAWVKNGPHAVIEGLKDLSAGNYFKGGHEVASGAGMTALPFAIGPAASTFVAAPVSALTSGAIGIGGGYLGAKGLSTVTGMAGGTPDQQDFAGDIGGILWAGAAEALRGPVTNAVKAAGPVLSKAAPALVKHASTAVGASVGGPAGAVVGRTIGDEIADAILARRAAAAPAPKTISDALKAVTATAKDAGVQLQAADALRAAKAVVDGQTVEDALSAVPSRLPVAARERAAPVPVVRDDISAAAVPVRAPVAAPVAAPAAEAVTPAASISPQRALNDIGIAAQRAKVPMTLPEAQALIKTVQGGVPAEQAVAEFAAAKDPAAALAKLMGTPSDADVQAAFRKRYEKGAIKDYAGRAK